MARATARLGLALLAALCALCAPAHADTNYSFSILHTFSGADGSYPAGMVVGSDGTVYGIAGGGPIGGGVFFHIDSAGNYSILHAFGGETQWGPRYLTFASDGYFYMTTEPAYDSNNNIVVPSSIFRLDSQGNCTLFHSFDNAVEGANPAEALIDGHDGFLYGITLQGSTDTPGAFFRIDENGNVLVLYAFGPTPGSVNYFLRADNGTFYGYFDYGVIISGFNEAESVFFGLNASGLYEPIKSVTAEQYTTTSQCIDGGDGNFYGEAFGTGPEGFGGIAASDASGNLTDLYDFTANDGFSAFVGWGYGPGGPLLLGQDGSLYGQTIGGDIQGQNGSIFRYPPDGQIVTLHSFDPTYPDNGPGSPLVQTPDGSIYGDMVEDSYTTPGYLFKLTPGAPSPPTTPAVITSLSQSSISAGSGAFTLTLTGTGFPAQPEVDFGTDTLPGTVNSDGSVSTTVPAADIAAGKYFAVRIQDTATGIAGPALLFTSTIPTPVITSVWPSAVPVGAPPDTLTITGAGFFSGTAVGLCLNLDQVLTYYSYVQNSDGTLTVQLTSPTATQLFGSVGPVYLLIYNSGDTGFESSQPITINVVPLNSYPAGLNMVSFPGTFPYTSVDDLFGYSGTLLATWNPNTSIYSVTTSGAAGTIEPGVGYWVRLPQQTSATTVPTPATASSDFTIPLNQGWNMIGDPFAVAVSSNDLSVVTNSFATISLDDAVAAGVVGSPIWGYSNSAGQYYAADQLSPYAGYWLYAYQPCQLLVAPPVSANVKRSRSR